VTDTGPGIRLGEQPYLFDKFFRVRMCRTTFPAPAWACRSSSRSSISHHGRIWVDSALGKGSRCPVVLPAVITCPSPVLAGRFPPGGARRPRPSEMSISYDLVQDSHTADRVRRRFAASISRLVRLGFGEVCIYRETGPAYSALTAFPAAVWMLMRQEVLGLLPSWKLSGVSLAHPHLAAETHAYALGWGEVPLRASRGWDGAE
jgi:hypothetical protein